eukprot:TRINITY_DN2016_c0_g1_i3.p1 TRINITY_DN2016_c0_g1~~TRINITY_DN2016_c0_g1_i3.p1  ORF type:complete len:547 (-),score=79.43 TRINITY_DN2016_c0_g1_i3:3-1643(-)
MRKVVSRGGGGDESKRHETGRDDDHHRERSPDQLQQEYLTGLERRRAELQHRLRELEHKERKLYEEGADSHYSRTNQKQEQTPEMDAHSKVASALVPQSTLVVSNHNEGQQAHTTTTTTREHREYSRDTGRDRSRDKNNDRDRDRDKDRGRDKDRNKARERETERDRGREKDRDGERDREKDRERDRPNGRDERRNREREHSRTLEVDRRRDDELTVRGRRESFAEEPYSAKRKREETGPFQVAKRVVISGDAGGTEQQRNRKMFGMLIGTLQRFKQDESTKSEKDLLREQVEEKVKTQTLEEHARLLENERTSVKKAKEEFQEQLEALSKEILEKQMSSLNGAWEYQRRLLDNSQFHKTETKPSIYYTVNTSAHRSTPSTIPSTRPHTAALHLHPSHHLNASLYRPRLAPDLTPKKNTKTPTTKRRKKRKRTKKSRKKAKTSTTKRTTTTTKRKRKTRTNQRKPQVTQRKKRKMIAVLLWHPKQTPLLLLSFLLPRPLFLLLVLTDISSRLDPPKMISCACNGERERHHCSRVRKSFCKIDTIDV